MTRDEQQDLIEYGKTMGVVVFPCWHQGEAAVAYSSLVQVDYERALKDISVEGSMTMECVI